MIRSRHRATVHGGGHYISRACFGTEKSLESGRALTRSVGSENLRGKFGEQSGTKARLMLS